MSTPAKSPMEKDFQKKILEWLKKSYPAAFVWKAAAGPYSQGGIPDVCAIIDGHFYGLEVKRPGGQPTALQRQTIKRINAAGGTAAVVVYPEDVRKLIESGT